MLEIGRTGLSSRTFEERSLARRGWGEVNIRVKRHASVARSLSNCWSSSMLYVSSALDCAWICHIENIPSSLALSCGVFGVEPYNGSASVEDGDGSEHTEPVSSLEIDCCHDSPSLPTFCGVLGAYPPELVPAS